MQNDIDVSKYKDLESKINYIFRDKSLLQVALTHSSFAYEIKDRFESFNERLEFLGDGILDFVIAENLFHAAKDKEEGYLSQTRALIVCESSLADVATELHLGELMRFGKGEAQTGGAAKASNLANALEALYAAIYLDGGFDAARQVILCTMNQTIKLALSGQLIFDYKSRLIEYVQAKSKMPNLSFDIIDAQGPVHDRTFFATVNLDGRQVGAGSGKSKKQAEQNAAKNALDSDGYLR